MSRVASRPCPAGATIRFCRSFRACAAAMMYLWRFARSAGFCKLPVALIIFQSTSDSGLSSLAWRADFVAWAQSVASVCTVVLGSRCAQS